MTKTRTSVMVGIIFGLAASAGASAESLPPIPNLAGKVLTVTGPVDPATLGQTLMHEHLFIDFKPTHPRPRPQMTPAQEKAYDQPITLSNLANARYGPGVNGNGTIGNFKLVLNEVLEFKKWGGHTVVDVSNIGLGRDPQALQHLSRVAGMNVVMGSGWYQKAYHPLDMSERTVDELTSVIVNDIVKGVNGTDIRSGIIGEVGVNGAPLIPNEMKSIRASARASRLTGAPITFHVGGRGAEKFVVLDVLESEGVDMSHVVMGHSGSISENMPLMKKLLERGVFLEFDYLGVLGGPGGTIRPRTDATIVDAVVKLVKAGYADRILLSHDICTKIQLKAFGGNGYSYISEYFLPELRRLGVSEADIHKIMVDNPRRALTFTEPKPRVMVDPAELRAPKRSQGEAASPVGPWLGTWERKGSQPGVYWVLQMKQVANGFRVVIDATYPGASEPVHMDAFARFDGKPYPEVGNSSADFDIFSRVDDDTYALRDIKDGKETVRFEVTISPDGQTRTSVASRTNAQGETVKSTGVWSRVEWPDGNSH